jgi:hypothetical protein
MLPVVVTPRGHLCRALVLTMLLLWLACGCGNGGDVVVSTDPGSTAPPEASAQPQAIWPSTQQAQLDQLRGQANRGQRPDLLDPLAVARGYLTTASPPEARARAALSGLVLSRFKATSAETGEVEAHGDRLLPTTVALHRYAGPPGSETRSGEKPIWYVQGLGSRDLAVLDVEYNGKRLSCSLVPTKSGRITARTSTLEGEPLDERTVEATPGTLVDVGARIPDQSGLLFTAVLLADDGTTALRIFRLGPPAPA